MAGGNREIFSVRKTETECLAVRYAGRGARTLGFSENPASEKDHERIGVI